MRGAVLLLAALAAASCGEARQAADETAEDSAVLEAADEAPTAVAPEPGAPWTAEDSARAIRDDSLYEARLMQARRQAMDSYEGCMEKTKAADPEHRKILEAACARGRRAEP
jgi:hypothetical protein